MAIEISENASEKASEFTVGDVVSVVGQLTKMTIDGKFRHEASCVWFDSSWRLQRDRFRYEVLVLVK